MSVISECTGAVCDPEGKEGNLIFIHVGIVFIKLKKKKKTD